MIIFMGVLGMGLTGSVVTLYVTPGPENIILGDWKESSWEYEKVNKINKTDKPLAEEMRDQQTRNLIIHEAEVWRFLPGGKLKLIGKNSEEIVDWRLKGRGNILEIKHSSNVTEHYSLTELSSNKMVLNFETDVQVRGIAKLTFEKIGN